MNITIVGAGNMGLTMTAYMTLYKKGKITLFTDKKLDRITLINEEKIFEVDGFQVGKNKKIIEQSDYIFCTYPAFLRKKFINEYGDCIRKGAKLGFVPGYGGAEYICKELIDRGVIVFG